PSYPICAAVAVAVTPAQAVVLHAVCVGSRPFGRRCCPRAAPHGRATPPCAGTTPAGSRHLRPGCPCSWATAPVGGYPLWAGCPCKGVLAVADHPLTGGLSRSRLPLAVSLAMGGRPCMGAGRGWSPLLAVFVAKMQQECAERFYAIQSHHTQFKTNLLYENLGSDTTVGKPQRIRMEKMKEVKRPLL
ncbi:hypothetical protein GW17_00023515, partial [Ensete ventricosum]